MRVRSALRFFVTIASMPLPWSSRRWVLGRVCGYQLHAKSRIGLSWVAPAGLVLEEGASIGHFTVCKGLDLVHLKEHASLGHLNWVTGFPASSPSILFRHQADRRSEFVMGRHSAVTQRHLIDCTDSVTIGDFSVVAGYRSQIVSHSVDLQYSRQGAGPVVIGAYCFVGTDSVVLGDSRLPDFSVLGAKSLLHKVHTEPYHLYAGVPARPIKRLQQSSKYFTRTVGYVD